MSSINVSQIEMVMEGLNQQVYLANSTPNFPFFNYGKFYDWCSTPGTSPTLARNSDNTLLMCIMGLDGVVYFSNAAPSKDTPRTFIPPFRPSPPFTFEKTNSGVPPAMA